MNPDRAPIQQLPKFLVCTICVFCCLFPAQALAPQVGGQGLVAAVTAPSPLALETDPAQEYRGFAQLTENLGLSREQRSVLWARLNDQLLARLEAGDLAQTELDYLSLPHYQAGLADRYAAYAQKTPDLPADAVVTTVNMGLDRAFYTEPEPVKDPDSTAVLVNKYHALDKNYVPELEPLGVGYGSGSLRPEAAAQFRAMADAARTDGVTLYSVSAYRSYRTQFYTYNNYLSQYSQQTVDNFSARPGYSEHQTGLALDINTARTSAHFETTEEYAWLVAHCAEYGFILRYPEDKTSITGYRFEPWHYRYVGVEVAQLCMQQGLTYEEYVARQPAEDLALPPVLLYEGQPVDLQYQTLMLDGIHYLSAARLAQSLGWTTAEEADTLFLSNGTDQLALSSSRRALRNGQAVRLSAPALELDGALYLSLDDLRTLLALAVRPSGTGLELIVCEVL